MSTVNAIGFGRGLGSDMGWCGRGGRGGRRGIIRGREGGGVRRNMGDVHDHQSSKQIDSLSTSSTLQPDKTLDKSIKNPILSSKGGGGLPVQLSSDQIGEVEEFWMEGTTTRPPASRSLDWKEREGWEEDEEEEDGKDEVSGVLFFSGICKSRWQGSLRETNPQTETHPNGTLS